MFIDGFFAFINNSLIGFFLGKMTESLKIIEIMAGIIGLIGFIIGLLRWIK